MTKSLSCFLAVVSFSLLLPGASLAEEKAGHPESRFSIAVPGSVGVAAPVVANRVFLHQETPPAITLLRRMGNYSQLVGGTTERIMDEVFARVLLRKTGGWIAINPGRVGNRGIDGLFIRVDEQGVPRDMLVAEAKFGTSRLGRTKVGMQMSDKWIRPRLKQAAKSYEALEKRFNNHRVRRASGRAAILARRQGKTFTIPIENRRGVRIVAEVWQEGDDVVFFSRDITVSPQRIGQQLSRIRHYLHEASQRKIPPTRKVVFRYTVSKGKHVIKTYSVTDGKLVLEETRSFTPQELPRGFRSAIRRAILEEWLSKGKPIEEAKKVAKEWLDNPEILAQLKTRDNYWLSPRTKAGLQVAFASGGIAAALDLLGQMIQGEEISYSRTLTMGGLGFASGATGYLVTTGIDEILGRSIIGGSFGSIVRAAWSSAGGAAAASIVFAYGSWLLGYSTLDEAHEAAAVGILASGASAIAVSAAWWAVATFGTASTGTAISSLSGAAATNAVLAWFGGGSLAAGGGGAALGATVLTGVGAVVALAVFGGYVWWKYYKDAKERRVISELDLKWNREHLENKLIYLRQQTLPRYQ